MTEQIIKRGILQAFSNAQYTATVLIIEATSYVLSGVPIATSVDGTSAIVGAGCAVLFLDAQNPADAVIIAVYGSVPAPPPGRITFVTGFQQVNGTSVPTSTPLTVTLTGTGGIPGGALGVLYRVLFSSTTAGASITLSPHGASTPSAYGCLGNLAAASGIMQGNGIVPVDSSGKIDITASGGTCSVTLYTYGYII